VDAVAGVAVFSDLSIDLVGDGYTLIATSGTLTDATTQAFNVTPDVAATLDVTGITDPFTAGDSSDMTVTARDAYGNMATGYLGTVTFTEDDPHAAASVPGNYAFLVGDAGVHTFTLDVTLATTGSRTVTATDTVTPAITGDQTVTVNADVPATLVYLIFYTAFPEFGAPQGLTDWHGDLGTTFCLPVVTSLLTHSRPSPSAAPRCRLR